MEVKEVTLTDSVEIRDGDLDIYVNGQLVLHIGQVSDNETINLFFYPSKGAQILESMMHQEDPDSECTHELLMPR